MSQLHRREILKIVSAGALAAASADAAQGADGPATTGPDTSGTIVPQWDVFEVTLAGPREGNPFQKVALTATFMHGNRRVPVDGFYDGEGVYKLRFMPDAQGEWSYSITSSTPGLDGHSGRFTCTKASSKGPVGVQNGFHFGFADGTPFLPFGTTCYAWVHQSAAMQKQTLASLAKSPFNKVRMCLFPKHYEYNHNEPALYPFERDANGKSDFTRPNPTFYRHLESCITALSDLNIEAEIILFHPYDRWGYAAMGGENDDAYLRYTVARLAAFRNVWWSMANEWDFMAAKKETDFDRLFRILVEKDPAAHLRSIHNGKVMYDHGRPWLSHISIQGDKFSQTNEFHKTYGKPVIFDEVQYEGNLNRRWGNLSGEEMTYRTWRGIVNGGYVTHGETLLLPQDIFNEEATPQLWWSHGGILRGQSPKRIGFLRSLLEGLITSPDIRNGLTPAKDDYYSNAILFGKADDKQAQAVLYFFDYKSPIWYEFPLPNGRFSAETIEPWAMQRTPLSGSFSGKAKIRLPAKPYQAILFRRQA